MVRQSSGFDTGNHNYVEKFLYRYASVINKLPDSQLPLLAQHPPRRLECWTNFYPKKIDITCQILCKALRYAVVVADARLNQKAFRLSL